ncbi:MAG: tRNA lysidine(34) synthetase TilS [bacterium]|nr:tRNA lysidine(34) synthetase TilS [bacterium]MCP4800501.1 tRNA lysidine(34) synthetase TilS [bacterium]
MTNFINKVLPNFDNLLNRLSTSSPSILCAISGGPDSIALLLAATQWKEETGNRVEAMHFNHHLRGDDSNLDEIFCRNLCFELDIPIRVEHTVNDYEKDPSNLEERCRIERRAFFDSVLDEDFTAIVTGHHLNDQVETVIMRLMRGAGLDGLRGIRPISGRTIHPMLNVSRTEIIEFLDQRNQGYRTDKSNSSNEFTRNRVRNELIPLMADIFDSTDSPARTAELLERDSELLDSLTIDAVQNLDPLTVDGLSRLSRPLAARVIRHILLTEHGLQRDLSMHHIDALLDWLPNSKSGSALDLVGNWRAVREFDILRFVSEQKVTNCPVLCIVEEPAPDASHYLTLPANCICGKPTLRKWQPGDKIRLPGLNGTKKISDLLREKRVGVSDRENVYIVEDDLGLLWVVGLAQAQRTTELDSGASVTLQIEF